MLDWDKWQEIIAVARKNRMRTALTVFGVFWGMLMLLAMLGFGDGLQRGVSSNMRGFATNSVFVWGQRTSLPFAGLPPGRHVEYDNDDVAAMRSKIDGLQYLAPRNQLGGFRDGDNVTHGSKTGNFQVMGDYPDIINIQSVRFEKGRFINDLDIAQRRKVAVIGKQVADLLFDRGDDPVGQYIRIQGVYFQVVGVYRARAKGDMGDRQETTINIPFTTFQQAFNFGNKVGWFAMTGKTGVSGEVLEKRVRALLAERHKISPKDEHAIGSFNAHKEFMKMTMLFRGIKIFMWIVGIMTLMAGVIGVSNIMLIAVKERTKEIGIRKAMGATPWSIISLVVQEAIVLTSLAGYLGIIAGVGLLALVGWAIPDNPVFASPQIDLSVALVCAAILIVSGGLAGVFPARQAARVNPVEALRAE